jgi:transposase
VAKGFRPVCRDQQFLLPPDMGSWLPEDHLAWFVISVVEELDLSAFEVVARTGGAGRAAYDPRMLLALLIYAYACGERSSRQIERLCSVDVAFRVICAQDVPDHTTIARFRQRHEQAMSEVFAQVLRLCARAGLGRVGVVSLDGTKIAANAARDANRDEQWLREQAARIVAEAGEVDDAEQELFGDARGDEMPPAWRDPRTRAARIKQALADLDAEDQRADDAAARRSAAERAKAADYEAAVGELGATRSGRPPAGTDRVRVAQARLDRERLRAQARVEAHQARSMHAAAQGRRLPGPPATEVDRALPVLRARAQLEQATQQAAAAASTRAGTGPSSGTGSVRRRNLTDPDSRLMPSKSGWVQGYNAQLVVTDDQIILAAALTQTPSDTESYQPMVQAAQAAALTMAAPGTEPQPVGIVLADAGYLSQANLTAAGPDRLIATGKRRQQEHDARHDPAQGSPPRGASPLAAMEHRLRTKEGITTYRRRGVTVEPVNGHLKDRIGLRRFARRGLNAATSELHLAATVANLLKVYRAAPATG